MKTLSNSSIFLRMTLILLTLAAAAPVANADTLVSYTATVPSNVVDFNPISATPDIPLFNRSLGTLRSVEIAISGTGDLTISVINTNTGVHARTETVTAKGETFLYLDSTNSGISDLLDNYDLGNGFYAILNGGASASAQLAPGTNKNYGPYPSSGSYSNTFTALGDIENFEGVGDYYLQFDTTTYYDSLISGGASNQSITGNADGTVTVTYDYIPGPPPTIPEPGTLTLFGTGLLGLAGVLRYKFMKSR